MFKILMTLFSKDTDPNEVDKPLWQKRRFWGVILMAFSWFFSKRGVVIDPATQSVVVNNIANSIDAVTGAWGAFLLVKGQVQQTKKIKAIANEAAVSPPCITVPFPEVIQQIKLPCPTATGRIEDIKSEDRG